MSATSDGARRQVLPDTATIAPPLSRLLTIVLDIRVQNLDTESMTTIVLDRTATHVRLDEHWVLVRLPVVQPMAPPRVGPLNSAEAVSALYR